MKDIWGTDDELACNFYYCYSLNSITIGIFGKSSLSHFFKILNLGFLPSGLDIDNNIKVIGTYTIPFLGSVIEVPLHFFMTLWINIVDFVCWIPSKIPILREVLYLVKVCPDLDLTTHGTDLLIGTLGLTGHRNFITHSVLNPYILLIFFTGIILYFFLHCINSEICKWIGDAIRGILVLVFLIHSAHLFADCMPQKWTGASLIKVYAFNIRFIILNGFLSKCWLMLNGFGAIKIAAFLMEDRGIEAKKSDGLKIGTSDK